MFFDHFLRKTIPPDDEVHLKFVTYMVPQLFQLDADRSAKGGEQSRNKTVSEETAQKYAAKADQSMVSHLLNGIFPTLHLLRILKAEGIGPSFSDRERQIYILAYLVHDIDKTLAHEAIAQGLEQAPSFETSTRELIDQAKQLVAQRLEACQAGEFMPDYTNYLEEITYLAVNTQQKWGTHLSTYLWQFRLKERQIMALRDLCRYSDIIAYLIPSPAAILASNEGPKLATVLADLSEDTLEFCYHQLREVRGLLTNVVNTSMIQLMTQGQDGIWPYLFFSNGVVYIKRKTLTRTISTEQMVETVQSQLREKCAGIIRDHAPGLKFDNKGILKHPDYYSEFLSPEEYIRLLARCTIQRTTNDITVSPIAKMRQMQAAGEIPAELSCSFEPDKRIGVMSRFFSVIFTMLLSKLDKQHQALQERCEREIVQLLELTPYWEPSKNIPNKGGVEYRWFWLAGQYLREHPGLDREGDERSLATVFDRICSVLLTEIGPVLKELMPQKYLMHLTQYLDSLIELPPALRAPSSLPDFSAELDRYHSAKSRKRKLLCTLCNSAYPAEEQTDNAVLFQPWVYKNKLSLYAGKNAGGMCTLCALELMLRQILQKGQNRLTGSKFEAQKVKYLTIYPNFFFTAETGALVSGVIEQLRAVNFFTVRKQLAGKKIGVNDLWELDAFEAPIEILSQIESNPMGDEDDDDNDNVQAEEAQPAADRGYVKYQPEHFPGLFLFGMRANSDDTDSGSWAMPAFLALTLPLVTATKVVISEMSLPLHASAHDFQETVIFDAPHPYLRWLLQGKTIRVNNLLRAVRRMVSIYRVNIDTYAKKGKPEWGHLSAIARALETDPLFLFSYLRKQERIDAKYKSDVATYLDIFINILEADMSKIKNCVDNYLVFYRGSNYNTHSLLKPVDIVAKAIINSPMNIDPDDLLLQMRGELQSWLDRVRKHNAAGWAKFYGKDITTQEVPAVEKFVREFYQEVFLDYCQGERGLLRSRINRFKDGCEAYYLDQLHHQKIQEQEEEVSAEPVEVQPVPTLQSL